MAEQADTTSGLRDAYRRAVAAAEPSAAEAPTAEPPVTPAHPGHDRRTWHGHQARRGPLLTPARARALRRAQPGQRRSGIARRTGRAS